MTNIVCSASLAARLLSGTAYSALRRVSTLICCALVSSLSFAQTDEAGFFSGARIDAGARTLLSWNVSGPSLKLGQALEYQRPITATAVGESSSTLFSGYQFANGASLGAALGSQNGTSTLGAGVGLKLGGVQWAEARGSTNLDIVSAFAFRQSLSVFGKVGVSRADSRSASDYTYVGALGTNADRPSLSYGVGLRYNLTPSLGLKLEVTRGTRFGVDRLRAVPDADAVNVGLRWAF